MGKIVKFCASCDEGFAEKFSFCPNCASELSAFEMKPVGSDEVEVEELVADPPELLDVKDEVVEVPEIVEEQAVFEPIEFAKEDSIDQDFTAELVDDVQEIEIEEPAIEEELVTAESISDIPEEVVEESAPMYVSEEAEEETEPAYLSEEPRETFDSSFNQTASTNKGAYTVTVVSERGGKIRNGLLLCAFVLITFGFLGMMVYSLFANLDDVASLNTDERLLALLNETPMQQEEEKKVEKDDDEGGGGGGGGKNNPKPVNRGELPSQVRTPQPPPIVTRPLTNPDIKIVNTTQGDIKRERKGRTGLPTGLSDDPSSGSGSGGGIGTGKGTGVGSGFGTGEGSGSGSGSGSGRGNGTGSGTGDGSGRSRRAPPPPPKKPKPPKPKGPTVGIKILSKPKPGYTDAARQNNVRGVVRVRVKFLSSGRIGGVSVVKGLPHGLTEKALAAARSIRFKPPMRNGVPYSVNKVVQFNFNIY